MATTGTRGRQFRVLVEECRQCVEIPGGQGGLRLLKSRNPSPISLGGLSNPHLFNDRQSGCVTSGSRRGLSRHNRGRGR